MDSGPASGGIRNKLPGVDGPGCPGLWDSIGPLALLSNMFPGWIPVHYPIFWVAVYA